MIGEEDAKIIRLRQLPKSELWVKISLIHKIDTGS